MKQTYPEDWPQFFTATIYDWDYLLEENQYKAVIVESLQFLVKQNRIILYGFVIMSNHIHLIWQPLFGFTLSGIQSSFMKHTSKQLKSKLIDDNNGKLSDHKVNKYDRAYQIWKREPLSIELRSSFVFEQKLQYIHDNPVVAGLCERAEDYYYSSANFYHTGVDTFSMLTHYSGN